MKRLFVDEFGPTVLSVIFLTLGVGVMISTLIVWGATSVDRHACETTLAQNVSLETNYDFPAGCFVKVDGKWVPEARWVENTGN